MLVKRYRGRVVQRMRRATPGHIELIYPSERENDPREREVITQAEWDQHGSEKYEDGKSIADFRPTAVQGHAA
jgi:hypothetical protein